MLNKLKNYGPYAGFTTSGIMTINTTELNIGNWNYHFQSILNVFRDGLGEKNTVLDNGFITVIFNHAASIQLTPYDYIINLIMWRPILYIGRIQPKHIVFEENMTRGVIRDYINKYIIDTQRSILSNTKINNLIDDTLAAIKFIDEFSMWIANTIDLESDVALMRKHPEVRDILNSTMANIPIGEVNSKSMELTNRLIGYITAEDSDHCMKDYLLAREGIKPKQYKEYAVNIGPKPDGRQGIFPAIIDGSFINGGLRTISDYFIESSAGRIAQILSKNNVGDSGHFARLLGINNSDTILHKDPNYICNTRNYETVIIRNITMLNKFKHRYYKLSENGVERKIVPEDDKDLIGRVIYLRSPITCASKSRGEGICYRCYGDLAYTNRDINAGKIAAEELSSILTQILLSAKHLLEAAVEEIKWPSKFRDVFDIDINVISIIEDLEEKYDIVINHDAITAENEEDDFDFNEYLIDFKIQDKRGKLYDIATSDGSKLYITKEFNEIIRTHIVINEDTIIIPTTELADLSLFVVKITNNELSKTLVKLQNIIDLAREIVQYDRNTILQAFIDTVIDGDLTLDAIHCEIIISNQIRSGDDILEFPNWELPGLDNLNPKDKDYQILTLKQSLAKHPSLVVTLSFQDVSRQLYNPLSFIKHKTSLMDVFFQVSPQVNIAEANKMEEELNAKNNNR